MNGTILDKNTKETLPGVSVYISDSNGKPTGTGVNTDANGGYSLDASPGNYMTITLIGYERIIYKVPAEDPNIRTGTAPMFPTFYLVPKTDVLSTVTIESTRIFKRLNWRGLAASGLIIGLSFFSVFKFLGKKNG